MSEQCAHAVGSAFAELLEAVEGLRALSVETTDTGVRIVTIVTDHDLDLWERVFDQEAKLYDIFPDLQADFHVCEIDSFEAQLILDSGRSDYLHVFGEN